MLGPSDLLRGQGLSAARNELIFPIVNIGPMGETMHFRSTFSLFNLSDATIQGTLVLYRSTGTADFLTLDVCGPIVFPPPGPEIILLEPDESLRTEFDPSHAIPFEGWARLIWEGGAVSASVELTLIEGTVEDCDESGRRLGERPVGEVLTTTIIPAVARSREFRVPIRRDVFRETALAVVNLDPDTSPSYELEYLGASGGRFLTNTFPPTIPGLGRVNRFVSQLTQPVLLILAPQFPTIPIGFDGVLRIVSEEPIAVAALDVLFPELRLVNVPVAGTGGDP